MDEGVNMNILTGFGQWGKKSGVAGSCTLKRSTLRFIEQTRQWQFPKRGGAHGQI